MYYEDHNNVIKIVSSAANKTWFMFSNKPLLQPLPENYYRKYEIESIRVEWKKGGRPRRDVDDAHGVTWINCLFTQISVWLPQLWATARGAEGDTMCGVYYCDMRTGYSGVYCTSAIVFLDVHVSRSTFFYQPPRVTSKFATCCQPLTQLCVFCGWERVTMRRQSCLLSRSLSYLPCVQVVLGTINELSLFCM